jgi:hypothetical protein
MGPQMFITVFTTEYGWGHDRVPTTVVGKHIERNYLKLVGKKNMSLHYTSICGILNNVLSQNLFHLFLLKKLVSLFR